MGRGTSKANRFLSSLPTRLNGETVGNYKQLSAYDKQDIKDKYKYFSPTFVKDKNGDTKVKFNGIDKGTNMGGITGDTEYSVRGAANKIGALRKNSYEKYQRTKGATFNFAYGEHDAARANKFAVEAKLFGSIQDEIRKKG